MLATLSPGSGNPRRLDDYRSAVIIGFLLTSGVAEGTLALTRPECLDPLGIAFFDGFFSGSADF